MYLKVMEILRAVVWISGSGYVMNESPRKDGTEIAFPVIKLN